MDNATRQYMRNISNVGYPIQINIIYLSWVSFSRLCNFRLQSYCFFLTYAREKAILCFFVSRSSLALLGFKEFYVRPANSRGALTPSNVHWTFSVRLNRFTVIARWKGYKEREGINKSKKHIKWPQMSK